MSQRCLFVLTNHDRIGPAGADDAEPTGFHLFEAAMPWCLLTEAGVQVDVVTPKGGEAPIDPSSREDDAVENQRFLHDDCVASAIADSAALTDISCDRYDAVYFPGGYGAMWDLPVDAGVATTVREFADSGRLVGAVCHGPAALVDARLDNGRWLVDGREIACFTDDEERAMQKDRLMPFLLGSRLVEHGATLKAAADFEAAVAVDGNLITGQNPASARGVGEALRDRLVQRQR
ncbi:MAG: type 1 glutamine amidotransferase domain-containing protein [Pseudomonadota bacterium]